MLSNKTLVVLAAVLIALLAALRHAGPLLRGGAEGDAPETTLLQAAAYVEMIESRQGVMISAPEEIAYVQGWIGKDELLKSAKRYGKSPYGAYLRTVAEGKMRYES